MAKNTAYYSQAAGQKLNNFGKFLAQTSSVVHISFSAHRIKKQQWSFAIAIHAPAVTSLS